MATDLQDKQITPDADANDPYNREFAALTDPEHYGQDATPGEYGEGGKSSFYNPGGEGGGTSDGTESSSKATSPGGLRNMEGSAGAAAGAVGAAAGFYAGTESPRKLFRSLKFTKKKTAVGSIVGLLTGGVIFGGIIASGPLEIVHLSEILLHSFSKSESDSSARTNSMFRYYRFAKTGDIGETRVGRLGSKVFAKTISQLEEIGVTFERNPLTGQVDTTKIDTTKLEKKFPALKGMTSDEAIGFLSEKFPGSDIKRVGLGSSVDGHKFVINQRGSDVRAGRLLNKSSTALLDNGKIVTGIKTHVVGKFFNTPSLFHPIKSAIAGKENNIATRISRSKAEAERQKALAKASEAQAEPAVKAVKSSFKSVKQGVGGALIFSALVCAVRDTADQVVAINRDVVVAPAALAATDIIATGAQIKSGQDLDTNQLAAIKQSFYSEKDNIYTGKALRSLGNLDGPGPITGTDLAPEHKQAFSNETTAKSLLDNSGANSTAAAVACSTPGKVFQFVLGVALVASGFFDAGASWGAVAAGKIALTAVAAGAAFYFGEKIAADAWSSSPIPDAVGNAARGNLLAYGSRKASEISSIASGGISLGNNASTLVADANSPDNKEFRSRSMFAKMFDVYDYRSLSGRIVDSLSPSATQNVSSMVGTFMNIRNLVPQAFSALIPHAYAAGGTDANYSWDFPQYGLPSSMLSAPQLADPYDNATQAVSLLKSDSSYADKAATCFGVSIAPGPDGAWDVIPGHDVDPNSGSYSDAGCSDIGKDWASANTNQRNWQRIIMFVFDTSTMKAAACYEGSDDQSCIDEGLGGGSNSSATNTPVGDISAYKNPFRDIKSPEPNRVDQGVDYGGAGGPVYAIGSGTVLHTADSGWPGGWFIVYKLDDGPAKGKFVFVAEECPAVVKIGQHVTSDTVLCNMTPGSYTVEIGWAQDPSNGSGYALAHTEYSEGVATSYGQNFNQLLQKLGAKPGWTSGPGVTTISNKPLPAGWPTW